MNLKNKKAILYISSLEPPRKDCPALTPTALQGENPAF
jgi:hypothetical protein